MSREGDLMRRALKRHLMPALNTRGFTGKTSAFQRKTAQWMDLLDVQYGKYGGQFILEFGRRERGELKTSWGEVVSEDKLNVAHLSPLRRARLEERGPSMGPLMRGFSFEGFGEEAARYDALASRVAALLPQVEGWLEGGVLGSHIHSLGTPGARSVE